MSPAKSPSAAEFRRYLYPPGHPRIADLVGVDAYAYREVARHDDFTGGLIEGWTPLYLNEFRGVTEDGTLRDGLYRLTPARPGEEAPVAAMITAADALLGLLDDATRERLCYPVDAPEWQTWANPEFMQFDTGLRLDYQPAEVRQAALDLVRASLSPEGYEITRRMMLINGFLGDVVGLPAILNDFSYNIALYGTPDPRAPWGWQLYGHHAAVNCLVVEGRMSLSPVFLGAEPDQIDEGPNAAPGTPFERRITPAVELMALLTDEQRAAAVVYQQMVDPAMPAGRVHPGDERHLAGAFQDNRVIAPEGVRVADLAPRAQRLVLDLVEEFSALLPAGPRAARMREVEAHLDETWFSWIGAHAPGEVFYYRIQSPVVIAELDHHCGVFLDYDTPKPFHIHTVLRTPHGNDYGRAWVRQWQAAR
ncbi:MAG: DUF3500 domain-containing protein [Nocardioides sp.]|uniref:DUF3500 domain-containing protein n=1 Tax=Nocardioides sp. TaxID=35761 RepID=UPI0039E6942D